MRIFRRLPIESLPARSREAELAAGERGQSNFTAARDLQEPFVKNSPATLSIARKSALFRKAPDAACKRRLGPFRARADHARPPITAARNAGSSGCLVSGALTTPKGAISTVVVHLCGRYGVCGQCDPFHGRGRGDPPACNAGPSRVLINRSCASRESQTSNTRKPALAEPAAARTVLGRAAGSARRDRRAWAALKHPVQPWS
jgi:hypothetical protein